MEPGGVGAQPDPTVGVSGLGRRGLEEEEEKAAPCRPASSKYPEHGVGAHRIRMGEADTSWDVGCGSGRVGGVRAAGMRASRKVMSPCSHLGRQKQTLRRKGEDQRGQKRTEREAIGTCDASGQDFSWTEGNRPDLQS